MKVVALAGGVGGAKLAHGLAQVLPAEDLTIIVNTGDDFDHLGLRICPDLDTVCYTLAGLSDPVNGWGRAGESWKALENLVRLGGPGWFRLGDQDLGLHLERTRRLGQGQPLSAVTRDFCAAWGIGVRVLPATDEPLSTWVETETSGWLPFQEYFVQQQCRPVVKSFRFEGAESAKPAPGVLDTLHSADWVIICPSNPWVSIGPILAVEGIARLLTEKPVVAVSPIIGGQALKGPAAKMYQEMGIQPSAYAVAQHYHRQFFSPGQPFGFVIDQIDRHQAEQIEALGMVVMDTNSIMRDAQDRRRLAEEVFAFCLELKRRKVHS
jgi:LPPG:FO 2-phospho-L-lactate transferase